MAYIGLTGFQIRNVIKRLDLSLEDKLAQFKDSFTAFNDELKTSPVELAGEIAELDRKIVYWQTLQAQYNYCVNVEVLGQKMTLSEAVKLVGAAARTEALWRNQVKGKDKRNVYHDDTKRRVSTEEVAKPTVGRDILVSAAKDAARFTNAVRAAIAAGNVTELKYEISDEYAKDLS